MIFYRGLAYVGQMPHSTIIIIVILCVALSDLTHSHYGKTWDEKKQSYIINFFAL